MNPEYGDVPKWFFYVEYAELILYDKNTNVQHSTISCYIPICAWRIKWCINPIFHTVYPSSESQKVSVLAELSCTECTSIGSVSANASNSSPVIVDNELSQRSRQFGSHRYRHSPVFTTVSWYAAETCALKYHYYYICNMRCIESTERQRLTDRGHELGFSEFCFDWNVGELSRNYSFAMKP